MAYLAIPNLGNYTIALASFVDALGVRAWATTATTPRAMQYGLQAAPESICLPFKAHLGHYIEAARAGVEYAMMVNSIGTCRLRYYRALAERILRDQGYGIRMFGLGYDGIKPPMIRFFDPDLLPFLRHTRVAFAKITAVDALERLAWRTRPREAHRGDTTRLMDRCLMELNEQTRWEEVRAFRRELGNRFAAVPVDRGRVPLQVGLVGEVSVLRDKTLNHNLEELLGNLGVEVRNYFLLGATIRHIFGLRFGGRHSHRHRVRVAGPYLKCPVGGHALDSVAYTVLGGRDGFDGMIHVCPAGCMPEISIRPVLRRVARDLDLPVLHGSFDEHTSPVGLATRLEAFVDVLRERRNRGRRPRERERKGRHAREWLSWGRRWLDQHQSRADQRACRGAERDLRSWRR